MIVETVEAGADSALDCAFGDAEAQRRCLVAEVTEIREHDGLTLAIGEDRKSGAQVVVQFESADFVVDRIRDAAGHGLRRGLTSRTGRIGPRSRLTLRADARAWRETRSSLR